MPLNPRTARARAGLIAALALVAGVGAAVPAPAARAAEPVSVAVVVPLTTPAPETGLLDAESLALLTSPAGALTRELDAVLATSATIALDPMIPASIRVLGSAAPDSALLWLERLEQARNEIFLLAYADADLSPFARADALDLAGPVGFGFALDPAAFGPAATPTPEPTGSPTASPTPTPTATASDDVPPPLPSTEELLAWPAALGRIAWPDEGSAAPDDVARYAAAGYQALLLSSANLSETASGAADLGGLTALVADSAASALLRQASAALDPAARDDALARLGVALDGLAAAHPGRSVVLTLGRGGTLSSLGLAESYATLAARDSTRMTGLSEVLAAPVGSATVVGADPAPDVVAAPELAAAVRAEALFATILADPTLITGPRRLELLALLAVDDVRDADWGARADAYLARSAELLDAVAIVDAGSVLVTSSNTAIPIRIANALDFPVTVRVDAVPRLPRLTISSPAEAVIEPGSTATLRLDAQAITNGRVLVDVTLSSPVTGTRIGPSQVIDVDLQAQWETVGLIVGAVVVLVFAGGIVRNVLLRRRARRPGAAGPAEDAAS